MKPRSLLPLLVFSLIVQNAGAALVLNPAQPITHKVQVQPIIVQQAAAEGGATATYFGNAAQSAIIEGLIDDIWEQAGVDVEFLPTTTYVDSFAYNGFPTDYSTTTRPQGDLSLINSAAGSPPKSSNSAVLNMFFVDVVPGFSFTSLNTANGLAFVDGNGVTQFVGSNLLTFTAGQEVVASVVSHEIGHNLGLFHQEDPGTEPNLMHSPGSTRTGERISAAQVATIFSDGGGADGFELLQPIPEPSGLLFGLLGLSLLGLRRQR